MTHRGKLIRAAIALSKKSDDFKFMSGCQAHADDAKRLLKRSYLQSLGAIRLLTLAENLK